MTDAERFDKINDRIGEMDEGEFFSFYSSYEQYPSNWLNQKNIKKGLDKLPNL